MRELASSQSKRVEVRGVGVVAECTTGVDNTASTLPARVHRNQVGVMLHQTKSAADVVVGQTNLQVRVGNLKIVKPDHEFQFSSGKGQRGFVVWRSPIIDSPTPGLWPKGTIKNWSGALVQVSNPQHLGEQGDCGASAVRLQI